MAKKKEEKPVQIHHITPHRIHHPAHNEHSDAIIHHSESIIEINKALIENFVNLQKVMTNLAGKFEGLSDNISKLLQLFEISAKSYAERAGVTDNKDREFLDKIDRLLDQNKTIAKGLMLMEEKIRGRVENQMPERQIERPIPNQVPQGMQGFTPSMMSASRENPDYQSTEWKKLPKTP